MQSLIITDDVPGAPEYARSTMGLTADVGYSNPVYTVAVSLNEPSGEGSPSDESWAIFTDPNKVVALRDFFIEAAREMGAPDAS